MRRERGAERYEIFKVAAKIERSFEYENQECKRAGLGGDGSKTWQAAAFVLGQCAEDSRQC